MNNIFGQIDKFIEIFRKKEYYSVDYISLNNYLIEFKEIDNESLIKIENVINNFEKASSIEDKKAGLLIGEVVVLENLRELVKDIELIIKKDFKETYFESIKENWEFNYFLTNTGAIYKNVLMISNRLQNNNQDIGDVIYPLLAIKKYGDKYYLWNLSE